MRMVTSENLDRRWAVTIAPADALGECILRLADLDMQTADDVEIGTLLRTAQIDDRSLTPFVHFVPGRYTRNCVYRDERFEFIVVCWADGSRSPIHDHGGSRCFVKIQHGSLSVDEYTLVGAARGPGHARLERAEMQIMSAGDIDVRSAVHGIHRVATFGGLAISLHVYAKPLDQCLVFDRTQQTCRIATNRYDRRPGAHSA